MSQHDKASIARSRATTGGEIRIRIGCNLFELGIWEAEMYPMRFQHGVKQLVVRREKCFQPAPNGVGQAFVHTLTHLHVVSGHPITHPLYSHGCGTWSSNWLGDGARGVCWGSVQP